jgi:hypothetical protein
MHKRFGPLSQWETEMIEQAYNWIFQRGCTPDPLRTCLDVNGIVYAFSYECNGVEYRSPKVFVEVRPNGRVLVNNHNAVT